MTAPKIHGLNIERKIAKGGMAEVYLAEQKSLGRKVAVKVMDARSDDPEFIERFLQEAKLLASLHHNNIITIYDFGRLEDGRPYLSMEYLSGGDLEKRIKQGVTEVEAARITKELARALNFVHQHDILHRDIKPANMLFRDDGSLVLTDFGIAKQVDNDVSRTRAGMTVGSPAYSSPEQAQGQPLNSRTDIYSAGVVLLEMLTGNNPFKANTHLDTSIRHIQMPIPRLPGKLARYQSLIDRMLAKNPKDRFASMLDVLKQLDNLSSVSQPAAAGAQHINADLLKRCVDSSKEFSIGLMKGFSESMAAKLDEMLEVSKSNHEQWALLQVLKNLRQKRDELCKNFLGYLELGYSDFARGEYQKDKSFQVEDEAPVSLSLVAHEDLERDIAAGTLVRRVDSVYRADLELLHERICHLIGKTLPLEACPVGPYQLAHHFKKTIQILMLERQVSSQFYKVMEKNLISALDGFYKEMNRMLVDAGILPKLTTAEIHKRNQQQASSQKSANGLNEWLDEEIRHMDEDEHAAVAQQQHPSHQQQSHQQPEPVAGRAGSISGYQQAVVPDAGQPSPVYQQQLVNAIRQMQQVTYAVPPGMATGSHDAMTAGMPSGDGWVPLPGRVSGGMSGAGVAVGQTYTKRDIVAALNGMQDTVARGNTGLHEAVTSSVSGVVAKFQELRPGKLQPCPVQPLEVVMEAVAVVSPDDGDEPKQLDQDDSTTIDLVGMIFDYMLKDEELPDSVKALLSYLHVPYIKVALLDPEMFARPEHPARILLNRLSETGALWLNKEGYGQFRIFDEIKRVVNRILNEFTDGVDLFEELLREFDSYVENIKRRIEQLEKLSVQRAEAEHYLYSVKAVVHKKIKTRVDAQQLPVPVVALLLYPWFDYLTSVMLRHGEASEQWHQGLQVIDNLLWSIKPKTTQHEIHRLENLRSILDKQIQAGLETIGYDQIKGQELMQKINQLQDAAAQMQAAPQPTVEDTQELERIQLDTSQREAVVLPPSPKDMNDDEKHLVEKLRLIEFGTWFEFNEEQKSEPLKLKVAWYNEESLSFLFVNSAGKQVSIMTALDIARRMIARTARIIAGSAKPFFERALEAIYKRMAAASQQAAAA